MPLPAELTKKIGPLPAWQWGAVGGGALLLFYFLKKKKSSSTVSVPAQSNASSIPGLSSGASGYYGAGGGYGTSPYSSAPFSYTCPNGSTVSDPTQCPPTSVTSPTPTNPSPITSNPVTSAPPSCGPNMQVNSTGNGCIPVPNCPSGWPLIGGVCIPPNSQTPVGQFPGSSFGCGANGCPPNSISVSGMGCVPVAQCGTPLSQLPPNLGGTAGTTNLHTNSAPIPPPQGRMFSLTAPNIPGLANTIPYSPAFGPVMS